MRLKLLPNKLAVIRLEPDASIPGWATEGTFSSITCTDGEISIFCDSEVMPEHPDKIDGWRAFRVAGQLDLHLTGVISTLAMPLAAKQISVFSISTHDTDYMLVQEDQLEDAIDVLRRAGHTFSRS
jgi:hypothetical protein